jgi:hypothetical protein
MMHITANVAAEAAVAMRISIEFIPAFILSTGEVMIGDDVDAVAVKVVVSTDVG